MFNYLSEVEKKFFEHHNTLYKSSLKNEELTLGQNISFYFKSLFTPFSLKSCSLDYFYFNIQNFIKDVSLILSPLTAFFQSYQVCKEHGLITGAVSFLKLMLASPFFWLMGVIDIALQATTLTLGLITRSIATIGYAIQYQREPTQKNQSSDSASPSLHPNR